MRKVKFFGAAWLAFVLSMFCVVVSAAPEGAGSQPFYRAVSGTIGAVLPVREATGDYMISIEDQAGNPAYLLIRRDTFLDKGVEEKLETGQEVVGFVKFNSPMTMIYPPQYPVAILAIPGKNQSIKADIFDTQGLSQDGKLKINPNPKAEIVLQDGTPFEGDIFGRKLVVYYSVTTMSMPPQAIPERIVVMFEEAVHPSAELRGNEIPALQVDVSGMPIIVENERILGISAYNSADGSAMIPARAVLEKLGYQVTWDAERQQVMVNGGISSFKAGSGQYMFGRMAPIELGTAPEVKDGVTYVPLSYFQRVLKVNNAYIFEGQIVFDNGEKME